MRLDQVAIRRATWCSSPCWFSCSRFSFNSLSEKSSYELLGWRCRLAASKSIHLALPLLFSLNLFLAKFVHVQRVAGCNLTYDEPIVKFLQSREEVRSKFSVVETSQVLACSLARLSLPS